MFNMHYKDMIKQCCVTFGGSITQASEFTSLTEPQFLPVSWPLQIRRRVVSYQPHTASNTKSYQALCSRQ